MIEDIVFTVSKITQTRSSKGITWTVQLNSPEGHRLTFKADSRSEIEGLSYGQDIEVHIRKTQRALTEFENEEGG